MAPSRQRIKNQARFAFEELTASAREARSELVEPSFLEEEIQASNRVGQIIAFLMVGPLAVVSLQIIVVFNQLMTQVFGAQPLGSANQTNIFAWLITLLTAAAYVAAVWTWFIWVRSGGFGWFTWRDMSG